MIPSAGAALDPGGMYDAIRSFPQHLSEGRALASRVDPLLSSRNANAVVVTGMGGSAIGGDLLRALCLSKSHVGVHVVRGYSLPAFVGEATIVLVSSYSGDTEETLSAIEDATSRRARIACIAAGGEVERQARRLNLPLYELPGGLQPRAALGYSLAAMLTFAEQIDLLSIGAESWEDAISMLEAASAEWSSEVPNPARDLAQSLLGKLPFIYSGGDLMEPVATRWCCQFAENAKVLAHTNRFPELNHNEIMGWEHAGELHRQIGVVALRDRLDHPRVRRRIELTRQLLESKAGCWLDVESRGGSELARMLSLAHLGDWVSLYLAFLQKVDPTPINLIRQLKAGL